MLHIYLGNKETSSCSEGILNEEEKQCTGCLSFSFFFPKFGGMTGDITYTHSTVCLH